MKSDSFVNQQQNWRHFNRTCCHWDQLLNNRNLLLNKFGFIFLSWKQNFHSLNQFPLFFQSNYFIKSLQHNWLSAKWNFATKWVLPNGISFYPFSTDFVPYVIRFCAFYCKYKHCYILHAWLFQSLLQPFPIELP